MITDQKFINQVYQELTLLLGQHNHFVQAKSMWKWCLCCKKKVLTISQPNDHITESRFADYRILCLKCQTTEIITGNNYFKKQELQRFLFDLIDHFNLAKIRNLQDFIDAYTWQIDRE